MEAWTDITEQALKGDYDGYIRFANQALNINGSASASSTNGLRVFNIQPNTKYRVRMVMQNRFRLACVANLTSGQIVTNYVFSPLDQNDSTNQGTEQSLEITSLDGQIYLCVGAWSTGAGDTILNTLATVRLEIQNDIPQHTVSFFNWDGTLIQAQTVTEGDDAIPPPVPPRPGYAFNGWDTDYHNVQTDLTVTALFRDLNLCTVLFRDFDGRIIKTEYIVEGEAAVAPENPVRDGYDFAYWDVPFDNITADMTVTAVYVKKIVHTVTFDDWDGNVLKTQEVEHGASASAPAVSSRDGYRFVGWSNDFTCVTADMTVIAQYEELVYYQVTFIDWNDAVLKTESVLRGGTATPPSNPTRAGYLFTGWQPAAFTNIKADTSFAAQYEQIIVYRTVSFYDSTAKTTLLCSRQVVDGQAAVPPLPPSKPDGIFDHWDTDFTCVKANMAVCAVFREPLDHTVILIYSAAGVLLQTVDKVMSASLRDSLDGELTFEFSTLAERGEHIGTGCVAEYENCFFNIVRVAKSISSGLMVTSVSCEHISYVLNDDCYKISSFDYSGAPKQGLAQLLSGTQFEVGDVEFTSTVTMKINQSVTRRAALMQFIALMGGEIEYNGHLINIRKHRGSKTSKNLLDTHNVTDVSVTYESRAATASYEVAFHKIADCSVGDEVRIVFSPLGVNTATRIIAMEYNPFYRYSIRVEVGDYKPTINDDLYRIEKSASTNTDDMSSIWNEFDSMSSTLNDVQMGYDSFLDTYREVKNISVGDTQFTVTYSDGSTETYNYSVDTAGRMTSITKVV